MTNSKCKKKKNLKWVQEASWGAGSNSPKMIEIAVYLGFITMRILLPTPSLLPVPKEYLKNNLLLDDMLRDLISFSEESPSSLVSEGDEDLLEPYETEISLKCLLLLLLSKTASLESGETEFSSFSKVETFPSFSFFFQLSPSFTLCF